MSQYYSYAQWVQLKFKLYGYDRGFSIRETHNENLDLSNSLSQSVLYVQHFEFIVICDSCNCNNDFMLLGS